MTTINKLRELAQFAPDMCRVEPGDVFTVGRYLFWYSETYGFCATTKDRIYGYQADQPALDWLQGALQQAIVARGWHIDMTFNPEASFRYTVYIADKGVIGRAKENSLSDALLDALLEAVNE